MTFWFKELSLVILPMSPTMHVLDTWVNPCLDLGYAYEGRA